MGVNCLLKIAEDYRVKWRFEYGIDKCVASVWGEDNRPDVPIMLGKDAIITTQTNKHMGLEITSDERTLPEICNRRISAAQNSLYAAMGIGSSSVPVSPNILSKIYWSICISRMTYGVEVTVFSESCINEMEHAHRQNAKLIQGLSKNVATPAPLATLGWMSIAGYIALRKILFLWHILYLPDGCIYKVLAHMIIKRYKMGQLELKNRRSPIIDMYERARDYRLDSMIWECINGVTIGSLEMKKSLTKRILWEYEKRNWRASCIMYKNLEIYADCVKNIKMHAWWIFLKGHPSFHRSVSAVVSVLLGSQPKGIQSNIGIKLCKLCDKRQPDDATHALFACDGLTPVRALHWQHVLNTMPPAMVREMADATNEKKATFILSGLGGSYIAEWTAIYASIASFVWHVYSERHSSYHKVNEETAQV